MPRLKKKVPAGTLCLIGQKGRILSDFAQRITDLGDAGAFRAGRTTIDTAMPAVRPEAITLAERSAPRPIGDVARHCPARHDVSRPPLKAGTYLGYIEEVVAQFIAVAKQHRHPFAVTRLEPGIGIDVKQLEPDAEFRQQRTQGLLHVVAEMAIGAREQSQRAHTIRVSYRRVL